MNTKTIFASLFMLLTLSAQAQVSNGPRAINLSVDPKNKQALSALAQKRIEEYENASVDSVYADENSCAQSLNSKKTTMLICKIGYLMEDRWNGDYSATMELDENGKIMKILTEEFEGSY